MPCKFVHIRLYHRPKLRLNLHPVRGFPGSWVSNPLCKDLQTSTSSLTTGSLGFSSSVHHLRVGPAVVIFPPFSLNHKQLHLCHWNDSSNYILSWLLKSYSVLNNWSPNLVKKWSTIKKYIFYHDKVHTKFSLNNTLFLTMWQHNLIFFYSIKKVIH